MLGCVVVLTSVTIGEVPIPTVCLVHEGTEDLYAIIPTFDGEERLTFSAKRKDNASAELIKLIRSRCCYKASDMEINEMHTLRERTQVAGARTG